MASSVLVLAVGRIHFCGFFLARYKEEIHSVHSFYGTGSVLGGSAWVGMGEDEKKTVITEDH